jgi:predicted  nucleic acid-binding Zn-ribbon protein
MNPVLEKLLVLQDRDSRLARLNSELARIPQEQAGLDRQEKAAVDAAEQAKTESRRNEADRKKLQMDSAAKMDQVRKYKTQLLEIKNNEQFHALQHEIVAAESEVRKIEDVELELMEKYEVLQVSVKQADAKLKETKHSIETQRVDLTKKAGVVQVQANELTEERKRLAAEIDESVLDRYDRIFRSKHGQAVVRISNGLCTGCHLKLTAQEIHDAQGGSELVTCTNCGRILYWTAE